MDQTIWMIGSGRGLMAELDGVRVVVSPPGEDGTARFLVLKPHRVGKHLALVQAGHRQSVRQAMIAAEQVARWLASLR